jgi:hypothetical protein
MINVTVNAVLRTSALPNGPSVLAVFLANHVTEPRPQMLSSQLLHAL